MRPYIEDQDFTLHVGDVREVLAGLPDESVHCCVTSPPYWGLRDYGAEGQLGLEATPDEYVARMVEVFREVRRVLRSDGTCWLNLGDSYVSQGGAQAEQTKSHTGSGLHGPNRLRRGSADGNGAARQSVITRPTSTQYKPKDLVGIPWRVAFALQADGWWLRSDIIWAKPNPMPESVTDRPTKSHEYLFLLTKSARYFFDQDAVRDPFEARPQQRLTASRDQPLAATRIAAGLQQGDPQGGTHVSRFAVQAETLDGSSGETPRGPDGRRVTVVVGREGSEQHRDGERWPNSGRNIRSVWEIATQPYSEAHFATFPQELPRRCISAGTSERGCCPECGAPWERETEKESMDGDLVRNQTRGASGKAGRVRGGTDDSDSTWSHRTTENGTVPSFKGSVTTTTGWKPTCDHGKPPAPCTVLDIFMGSGTTALVARKLGRTSIGIELNESYAEMCARRLGQQSLLA